MKVVFQFFILLSILSACGISKTQIESKKYFLEEKKLILSKLNDSSYVFTTFNIYDDIKFSANGLIKICSDGIVLIDTPWDSTQFQPLLDEIKFHF